MAERETRLVLAALAATVVLVGAASESPTPESVSARFERGEFEAAVLEGRALLRNAEATSGPDSLAAAEACELIARAMAAGRLGEERERLAIAERSLAIREAALGPHEPALASARYVVGLIHDQAGRPVDALLHFAAALRIVESAHGTADPALEVYVREHGAALFEAGRYTEAKQEFERLREITRSKYGAGHPGTVPALYNLGLAHDVLGELNEAEGLYREAREILERQQPVDARLLGPTLEVHAGLLVRQGRVSDALEQLERALDVQRKYHGEESTEVAQMLVVRAATLWPLGDLEKARSDLETSLAIQHRGGGTPKLAVSAHFNLANVLFELGDTEAARASLDEALRAGSSALPPDHSLWGEVHACYGKVLAAGGAKAAARKHYERAISILTATLGESHYDVADALVQVARFDLADGDARTARERLVRALEILELQFGAEHPKSLTAAESLSEAHYTLREHERAFETAIGAERGTRELNRATLAVLPERQALAQASRPRAARDLAIALALAPDASAAHRAAAYDAVIRSRAVVFDEMAARRRFERSETDPEVRALTDRLREAKTRLANLFVIGPRGDAAGYATRLRAAREAVESLETEFAKRNASFRARATTGEFGYDALRRALPAGATLVSFVRYGRPGSNGLERIPYYAAVVQPLGAASPIFVDLGPAAALEQAVSRWREELEPGASEPRYRDVAEGLRRRVWDPLVPHLAGAAKVFVVPDGSVHLVSFVSLPADDGAFLVERGPTFHHLTAERDLAPRAGAPVEGRGLLALGDPAFEETVTLAAQGDSLRSATATCASFRSARFDPLPAAGAEVAGLQSLWEARYGDEAAVLLVGRAATEAALKARAAGRRVLHLATHGFLLGEECGAPGPYRGIGGLSSRRDPAPEGSVSPLLLYGLALAGANERDAAGPDAEDGIITAEEVSALDLGGVQLTVLSACRTGAGHIAQGEGLFGLRRAFLVAGAGTVVTNLWDVEDRAGQAWIERFYREKLLGDRSVPEAMRAASRGLLEARRSAGLNAHPFFWAGWLAVGDTQ